MSSDEADDAFMYFDQESSVKILGGSKDERVIYIGDASMAEVKAFQISEVGFSVDNTSNIGTAVAPDGGQQGGDTGKVTFNPIQVKKITDLATPALLHACASGTKFNWAKIELRRNGMTYLKITLEGAVLSNVTIAQSDDSEPTDNVTVHYAKILVEYCEQDSDGELFVPVAAGWDRENNEYYGG